MNIKRPMKPATISTEAELEALRYPVYVSPKIDGIRATIHDEGVLSASGKLLPNKHVQRIFSNPDLIALDGELVYGEPNAEDVFRSTTSVVMSNDKIEGAEVTFYVFDECPNIPYDHPTDTFPDMPFEDRLANAYQTVHPQVEKVPQYLAKDATEVCKLRDRFIDEGFEGICIRDPKGKYKHGRSTMKQQYLLKWKPMEDSEAQILGMVEAMKNLNPATHNDLGYSQRSNTKDAKEGKGYVGYFVCRDIYTGEEFKVGVFKGVTIDERRTWWDNPSQFLGKIIKYSYMPTGYDAAPRQPKLVGFRHPLDIEDL